MQTTTAMQWGRIEGKSLPLIPLMQKSAEIVFAVLCSEKKTRGAQTQNTVSIGGNLFTKSLWQGVALPRLKILEAH